MSIGIIFALVAAVGYSLRSYFYKAVIKQGVTRNIYLLSYRFLSIPYSLFLIWILKDSSLNTDIRATDMLLIALSVLVSFFADISYYHGFSKIQLSVASIFSRVAPVFSLIISFIFLKETPKAMPMIGIFIIVSISLWLVKTLKTKEGKKNDKNGILSVLTGQVLYTINGTFIRYFYVLIGGFSYMFYFSVISTLLILIPTIRSKEFSTLKNINKRGLFTLIVLDIVSMISFTASIIAFGNVLAPVAYALTSFGFIFTFVLGYVFLGERDNILKKIIATITMIVGGLLASF